MTIDRDKAQTTIMKCSFFGFVAGVLIGLCTAAMLAISIRG